MLEVRQTAAFRHWLSALKDRRARARIGARIDRLGQGALGDVKPVGGGVSELRLHYGPGYRLYFAQVGATVVLLLCGGDKSTQDKDIALAKALLEQIKP